MTVKNELDKKAHEFGTYDDGRSDDKGSEPESVVAKWVQNILFVGLERTDNCMIYDEQILMPVYLQTLKHELRRFTFIPASKVRRKEV
jgi:hypothetical protein